MNVLGGNSLLFNSYEFIFIFLPLVLLVYYALPRLGGGVRAAGAWLALMSLGFYGYWDVRYVPLLLASVAWNYLISCLIERTGRKDAALWLGIAGNVLLLGYYKYAGFFVMNLDRAFGFSYEIPHIILPLGISFFTFTQTAYLVDVKRGEAKVAGFLTFLEFVTIFPHLIAGPIISYREMLPQFLRRENLFINWHNMALGLTLFTLGLAKKVLIADRLSPIVGNVFSHAATVSCFEAWLGALAYTFQLYFDFSGYSEMAIGLGLMLNLRFPVNFDSPYQAGSIIDFWRRWHMTLGTWVKNYLYIPMGGNRHGELKKMRNLLASMLIIGLWHGAGWTFILWGGLHGVALVINHQWRRLKRPLPMPIARTLTFLTVMLLWVFFRADNFHNAMLIFKHMSDLTTFALPAGGNLGAYLTTATGFIFSILKLSINLDDRVTLVLLCGLVLMFAKNPLRYLEDFQPKKYHLAILIALLWLALFRLKNASEFLYFQF